MMQLSGIRHDSEFIDLVNNEQTSDPPPKRDWLPVPRPTGEVWWSEWDKLTHVAGVRDEFGMGQVDACCHGWSSETESRESGIGALIRQSGR
jgi:hypothetical protein